MLDRPIRPDPLVEPQPAPQAEPRPAGRLAIIDKLRGLVIVVMVLDHVRHFFHHDALLFSPTDVDKTSALLFATRWVTHLCAPTFVLLAGVSVYLQRVNGRRGWPLARFLLVRGLWLIALEVVVVGFGFNFAEPTVFLQVIWAIGFSFILLAPLVAAPPSAVLVLGLVLVAGHDAFDHVRAAAFGRFDVLWELLMQPGRLGHLPGYVAYPALPWFGIMACGYGAGRLVLLEPGRRDRWLVGIGLSMLALFALLRGLDGYGDPDAWKTRADGARTVLDFLKVTKYPPSLDYVLVTLGLVLTLTPLVARIGGPAGRLLLTFGRVPLFVYLLHLYLAHGLALAIGVAMGIPARDFFGSFANPGPLTHAGWGFGLAGVYLAWIAIVVALWPLAAWFAAIKARRRDWWLAYI